MGPYVDSIIPDEAMPAATQVVVIGGGIIGTFAALTLAGRGIPVVLCEKGYIACEQSSRNWGWCRQAGRDAREMPLIVQSLRLVARDEPIDRIRHGFSRVRRSVCGRERSGRGALRRLGGHGKALRHRHAYRARRRTRRAHAGSEPRFRLRIVRAHRRLRGTAASGAGDCARRAAPGRGHSHSLCRARHRAQRRPRRRGHHGARAYRLRGRHAGRRRVVQPVLRESRHSPAAAESTVLRDAHGARCARTGPVYLFGRGRLPQAA